MVTPREKRFAKLAVESVILTRYQLNTLIKVENQKQAQGTSLALWETAVLNKMIDAGTAEKLLDDAGDLNVDGALGMDPGQGPRKVGDDRRQGGARAEDAGRGGARPRQVMIDMAAHGRNLLAGRGMTIHACQLRPQSRGEIGLKSADPAKPPAIQPNYLQTGHDLEMMLECAQLSKEIFNQKVFDAHRDGFIFPETSVRTKDEIIDFIRRKAETVYHPVGTCKMGDDERAVVDERLRVRGLEGLRIADASVMPTILSGNTNAACIVIADRCADMILRDRG